MVPRGREFLYLVFVGLYILNDCSGTESLDADPSTASEEGFGKQNVKREVRGQPIWREQINPTISQNNQRTSYASNVHNLPQQSAYIASQNIRESEKEYPAEPHSYGWKYEPSSQNFDASVSSDEGDESDWYEGISSESTKPRREEIATRSKPASPNAGEALSSPWDVLTQDGSSSPGVRCPGEHTTGLFAYPPDCRFYVECSQGRAFVMPCAPGTLFDSVNLECDFPNKVKCLEFRPQDESSLQNLDNGYLTADHRDTRKQDSPKEPKCPAYMYGMIPHPNDCSKYLLCANGNTFIMDCGHGTVFNPDISVCDWPNNVAGCGGGTKPSSEEAQGNSEYPDYHERKMGFDYSNLIDVRQSIDDSPPPQPKQAPKKVECPKGFSGLTRHPNDCNKYLQCANGATYVMDCAPGTVFNPASKVCDWLANVPECARGHTETALEDSLVAANNETPFYTSKPQNWQSSSVSTPPSRYGGTNGLSNKPLQSQNKPLDSPKTGKSLDQYPTKLGKDGYPQKSSQNNRLQQPKKQIQDNTKADTFQPSLNQNFPTRSGFPSEEKLQPSSQSTPKTKYTFNGHGYPYVTESYNVLETTEAINPGGDDDVPTVRPIGGSAWAESRQGINILKEDKGNIGGKNNQGAAESRRNQNNLYTPGTPGSKPETWRGLGPGFENRPSVTSHDNSSGRDSKQLDVDVTSRGKPIQNLNEPDTSESVVVIQGHSSIRGPNSPSTLQSRNQVVSSTQKPAIPATATPPINPDFVYPDQLKSSESIDPNIPTVSIESEEGEKPREVTIQPNRNPKLVENQSQKDKVSEIETQGGNGSSGEGNFGGANTPQTSNFQDKNSGDDESVVMKINNRKNNLYLGGNQETINDEPPFPVHYREPQTHFIRKPDQSTPVAGQFLRLRGGPSFNEGYVEVQGMRPGWGTVCDSRNNWNLQEGHIVCRQLGFERGAEAVWQGRQNMYRRSKWIATNSVVCHGNETYFQSCRFTHRPECNEAQDAVGVRCLPNRFAHCREDETPYKGNCYHVAESSKGFNRIEAHDHCNSRGSRLVDVINQKENDFLSELLVQTQPHVHSVMTSAVGFTMLNASVWIWENSNNTDFKFKKWWPGWTEDKKATPSVGSRPLCMIMSRKFPCHNRPEMSCATDYYFWDVEDCATSNKGHYFICERPFDDIGCVYGNGNQYSGNASIAVSGKKCLPWSSPQIARSLMNQVPDIEARNKLESHSYCRNPNPEKESRPWCFTSAKGEVDYCDIPYCGKILSKKARLTGTCKPKHFECLPGECIPAPWVCDGQTDCTNGADEEKCSSHLFFFKKYANHKLDGFEVEKWLNTPAKTCALRCKEAAFTCRSFTHQTKGNTCYLSDSNIGLTGALVESDGHDYYELRDLSIDCDGKFVCANQKCINQTRVCDGKNDCLDRSDEKVCSAANLDYGIRLAGTNSTREGRVEVRILGKWGQVCDDKFDMADANVVCRELGFNLGALEIKRGGFYGNMNPPDSFMVDQLKCLGNESTIRECDFDGWGKHNCKPEEAVGIICKTPEKTCQKDKWKCENSSVCIPTPFICDEVTDCPDGSDESSRYCDAPFELRLANGSSPLEGRVEVRHHGIWGTVCDDDFTNTTAKVICRSLGYHGPAMVKKDGIYGQGDGPIWLDQVYCHGNETRLNKCEHDNWGRNNCNHDEDVGVVCSSGQDSSEYENFNDNHLPTIPDFNTNRVLPAECGKRLEDFDDDDELIFEKVVRGSIAPPGSYPWQASIRIRTHSKSSHWCGAVILSPLHVLTAAHCLEGYNKGTYFVRAGDYNTEVDEGTEAEANIEDYYIHENFRKGGHRMDNDIAVVLLKGHGIPLGRNVMPICLPHPDTEYSPGLNCTISGFGAIEPGSSIHSQKLKYGWVPLIEDNVCRADWVYGRSITKGMFCAGHLEGGTDTCEGDSGGPLACLHNGAFTLYGLTSWGKHCGRPNKPGVYVRVAYYKKWIDKKIRESMGGY
ncbi:hypothetical protein QAD02_010660 [Eretmocerus hayati]|uniref:Uncharacterized protein n=1 Tax=Eretmocerus hayati TaxID=131215 RepID=A0ACC2NUG6_9HYME|nr:hypothetical protein QAD02_010660 [Eretmocerus hayati]